MPSWKPLAAIVRHALVDYLSRQPESSQHPVALATTLAVMAASIEDLRSQVQALSARLDALAAIRQPLAATLPRSRQTSRPLPMTPRSTPWVASVHAATTTRAQDSRCGDGTMGSARNATSTSSGNVGRDRESSGKGASKH